MPEIVDLKREALDPIMEANLRYNSLRATGEVPGLINSAVGQVYDEVDRIWRPQSVRAAKDYAERQADEGNNFSYVSPRGYEPYLKALVAHVSRDVAYEETIGRQTSGGTGAVTSARWLLENVIVHDGLDFPEVILDSGWPNYKAIFQDWTIDESARIVNPETHHYDHAHYLETLRAASPRTVVHLQSSGYNGDGIDRTAAQWNDIVDILANKEMIVIVDSAYQGLSEKAPLPEMYVLQKCVRAGLMTFLANSQSKNMGLYNYRVGAMIGFNYPEAKRPAVQDAINKEVRRTDSNPPLQGAAIAAVVLGDEEYYRQYRAEVEDMRGLLQQRRAIFADTLGEKFEWVKDGSGLFTTLLPKGFTDEQVRLLENDGIIALKGSRINFGISTRQIRRVAEAIAAVL